MLDDFNNGDCVKPVIHTYMNGAILCIPLKIITIEVITGRYYK